MAQTDFTMKVDLTDKFSEALQKTREEVRAAKEALSEEHIRQIVREEIAAWEKQQVIAHRVQVGWRPNLEAK